MGGKEPRVNRASHYGWLDRDGRGRQVMCRPSYGNLIYSGYAYGAAEGLFAELLFGRFSRT